MSKFTPRYDEGGKLTIIVDSNGVHEGVSDDGARDVARGASLIEQVYEALGWHRDIRNMDAVKISIERVDYAVDLTPGSEDRAMMHVTYRWRDTGEEGMLDDPASKFPSATLVAALSMMVGPLGTVRKEHRKLVEHRTAEERSNSKRSNRPW